MERRAKASGISCWFAGAVERCRRFHRGDVAGATLNIRPPEIATFDGFVVWCARTGKYLAAPERKNTRNSRFVESGSEAWRFETFEAAQAQAVRAGSSAITIYAFECAGPVFVSGCARAPNDKLKSLSKSDWKPSPLQTAAVEKLLSTSGVVVAAGGVRVD
ncbi:hypothetical protein PTE30175_04663 [Pandoraea terrae]|uniref:Uncharacterized protein n=1 Tax=Pandoraea terrae TaxID=1537710 RepID=A0A5E4YVL1_9BURK|nr:hypothetical protein [Pandoraea terrae]VVE52180.1 hypothetical protein PTE30175_04663 [Pandoraea terrae]